LKSLCFAVEATAARLLRERRAGFEPASQGFRPHAIDPVIGGEC
jgi:hypothetical protein